MVNPIVATSRPSAPESARILLFIAAALVLVVWQLPFGPQVLYPFTILATYAHEMGHGIAALLMGASFERLLIYPDGSGLAEWRGDVGRIGRAFIAAGGLIGPSVLGSLVLVASSRPSRARLVLGALAIVMALSLLFFVRSLFGLVFVATSAAALFAIARFLPKAAPFGCQLVGVLLCLSVFRDLDYMFSAGGVVAGIARPSDSAAIADALLLPYWFWGGLVALSAFAVLGIGLWLALRPART
jgi:hypothetical protein